jgi:crossover junction endodeoxyribonuclease RuvC
MVRYVGIDPSTKTGFVALDEAGNVERAKELTGAGFQDPKRMATLIDEIVAHIRPDDVICIEGFAFGAQGQGVAFQYGLGHGIRMALYRRGMAFYEVSPAAVKKFATGKGNTKKDAMAVPIYRKWGFEHGSDNVRDAFVMAQIARFLHSWQEANGGGGGLAQYQAEVIEAILGPTGKKKSSKRNATTTSRQKHTEEQTLF